MNRRLLGGLTPDQFLKRHWQKKPLLVRGAFANFVDPLTPDELAGMALEGEVESRLIFEKGRKRPWQLEHGPFAERTLRALPPSHWTLLVQGVNLWQPKAAAILDAFRFVPGWRLDDLMVSFAPPMGTVGPHIDSYDVFLIQGMGRRRWQIDERPDPTLVPDLDLKILQRFKAREEWILEPGDMLYLPPGVAHYGVALENCLTYSVGFRAPSHRALLEDLLNLPPEVLEFAESEKLYADPDLRPARNPGELDRQALARLRALVDAALNDEALLARWLGRFATTSPMQAEGRRATARSVETALASDRNLVRNDRSRLAFYATGRRHSKRLFLFVDGQEESLPPALIKVVELICGRRRLTAAHIKASLEAAGSQRAHGVQLLARLVAHGSFTWQARTA